MHFNLSTPWHSVLVDPRNRVERYKLIGDVKTNVHLFRPLSLYESTLQDRATVSCAVFGFGRS